MAETTRTTAGKRLAQQAGYYIREHSEQKFSLSGIASALYVNGNYLARVFKRETGRTLLWYHNAIRCEKAKHLLDETDLSVCFGGRFRCGLCFLRPLLPLVQENDRHRSQ